MKTLKVGHYVKYKKLKRNKNVLPVLVHGIFKITGITKMHNYEVYLASMKRIRTDWIYSEDITNLQKISSRYEKLIKLLYES